MKELLKNKFMISIMVFMIGFSYITSNNFSTTKMEENNISISYNETK